MSGAPGTSSIIPHRLDEREACCGSPVMARRSVSLPEVFGVSVVSRPARGGAGEPTMSESAKQRFYVEVEPTRDRAGRVRHGSPVRVLRMTKSLPALAAGNIAVAVELTIPWEAFQPHEVALVVKPSRAVLAADQPDAADDVRGNPE